MNTDIEPRPMTQIEYAIIRDIAREMLTDGVDASAIMDAVTDEAEALAEGGTL